MYEVIDSRTGTVVGRAQTLQAAYRIADRKDAAYGGCRYVVRRTED